jgi:hypothetical protein
MRRVYICSPYAGHPEGRDAGKKLALDLCECVVSNHHAPFAPHALYPSFLNDKKKRTREEAIDMSLSWLAVSELVLVFKGLPIDVNLGKGISEGMYEEIELAKELYIPLLEVHCMEQVDDYFDSCLKMDEVENDKS